MFNLFGPRVPQIDGKELSDWMTAGTPLYIVDVRTPPEFRTGHIPGAHLIPLGQLAQRLQEIPKEVPVVTVCRSGSRSFMAAQQLAKAGYDVKNLHGGMQFWQGKVKK